VSLGEHGAGRWIAVFFHRSGGHEPLAAESAAQEWTPWRAVQRAAWEALARADLNLATMRAQTLLSPSRRRE
jgi:hypothetical protein